MQLGLLADTEQLEADISRLEREINEKKEYLENIHRNCPHQWGETRYTPEEILIEPLMTIPNRE